MSDAIQIIDPDFEKRRRRNRKVLALAVLFSVTVLGYPGMKAFLPKWKSYSAARKLAVFLNSMKTQAILKKTVLEARFLPPNVVEVYEASTCGPGAKYSKLWDFTLAAPIEFIDAPQARNIHYDTGHDASVQRFCYDPLYGSSLLADGVTQAAVYVLHRDALATAEPDHIVALKFEGSSGELHLE